MLDYKILKTYSELPKEKEFAGVLLKDGFEDVPVLTGKGSGVRFIVGYSFKDGSDFYFATEEAFGSISFPLGLGHITTVELQAKGKNTSTTTLAKKATVLFERWNEITLVVS